MPLSIDKGQLGMSASEKLELLKKQLLEKANKDTAVYPMSYGQKALYFLYVNSPDSSAYNVSFTTRIISPLNTTALKKAFQKIVNRHEALRTNYRIEDDKPVQIVNGYSEVEFSVVDVSDLREDEIKNTIVKASKTPFDLENGSVFRVILFRKNEKDHILLINVHHISNDGRSVEILLNDLGSYYESEINEGPADLPALQNRYHDFCALQEEFIESEKAEKQLDYWKSELSGVVTELDLPYDKHRPAYQSYNGDTVYFEIDKDLSSKISESSRDSGATLFAYLLAAYMTFLKLYSESDEIVAGIPASGRSFSGFENVMGYFINPVSVRIHFEENMTFRDVLANVKRKILNAVDNQDYPFQLLVDEILVNRDASRSPVFQTFFGLQKIQTDANLQELIVPGNNNMEVEFAGLKLRPYTIPQQEGQFDITAEFSPGEQKFSGAFKYSTDLLERSSVETMTERFLILLQQVSENCDLKISEIELISSEEKKYLLNKWNETHKKLDSLNLIDELFRETFAQFPERTALKFEGNSITYAELNERAERLASHITSMGFGRGDFASVCVERSEEMVVSILAILKAGGAYIPVDPLYPEDRVKFMLDDSGSKLLITQRKYEQFTGMSANTIFTDDFEKIYEADSKQAVMNERNIDDPAYVIYTSGTTGKPKGVVISHRALANHMSWMKEAAEFNSSDCVLQKTPFSFDASVWEFFLPLLNGGTLVMAKPDGHMDMNYLIQTIKTESVTHIQFVPSLLRLFIGEPGASECKSLKFVFSGGEALTGDLRDKVFGKLSARLVNLYGPTEATIDSIFYECDRSDSSTNVPIGRPIYNIRAYVVNSSGKLIPSGMPGELLLGGDGIALGYLNNPQLTSEKFIENTFDQSSGKLYKTGDKVRYNNSGQLEYLGRIDHQVKFRGYRIELGEIEAVIKKNEAISEAYADVRTDTNGKQTLLAYVKANGNIGSVAGELSRMLKSMLPEYMIPSRYVLVDEFPKLPNGKIDRKNLPDPEFEEKHATAYAEAGNEVEKTLASIWKDVLGLKEIGINDNFFELGGDSITSIQIISRASREGLKITPRQMFTHQTISELASEISSRNKTSSNVSPYGDTRLTPVQIRFLMSRMSNHSHFNHSLLIDIPNDTDAARLESALNACIRFHDALRLKITNEHSGFIPDKADNVRIEVIDLRNESVDNALNLLEAERRKMNTVLSLSTGELVNCALFSFPDESKKLLINIHHISIDGVSWRVLLDDMANAYRQLLKNETHDFGSKGTSFREWTQLIDDYSRSEKVLAAAPMWNELAKFNNFAFKEYSGDSKNTYSSAQTISVSIDESDTALLQNEANKSFNTKINDLMLSAVVNAISKFTSTHEVLLDLEGHGRDDIFQNADISGTVGWFTSIYPTGFKVYDNSDVEGIIRRVRESKQRYANQEVSYAILRYVSKESLVSKIDPPVVFNYLGQFNSELTGGWAMNKDSLRLDADPDGMRQHVIEINSMIINSRLEINIEYSSALFDNSSMHKFADLIRNEIKNVLNTCMDNNNGKLSATDFDASGLSQQELDELLGG